MGLVPGQFHQDDGHIFCREDQVEAEVGGLSSAGFLNDSNNGGGCVGRC
jgi:hypothetical protein